MYNVPSLPWLSLRSGGPSPETRRNLWAGALAGFAGGLGMMLIAAIVVSMQGLDVWFQAKALAELLLGGAALVSGFAAGPVLLGMAIHLAVSVLLGMLYGFFARNIVRLPSDMGIPAVTGLMYGMVLWFVAYFMVAPWLSTLLQFAYAPALIFQHIVFGLVTGMLFAWLRPRPYAQEG